VSRRPRLGVFVRASVGHIGAAAAAASLRDDLVGRGSLPATDFDRAYAVARLTPGTNLLAFYALLGHRLGGWRLALGAVAVGTVAPAALALLVTMLYATQASNPLIVRLMQGARAGALAVFLWAVVRLIRPQLVTHGRRGMLLAAATLVAIIAFPAAQLGVLLIAAAAGAAFLQSAS
jgi:chromate transporter